jgi:hypothetical protein
MALKNCAAPDREVQVSGNVAIDHLLAAAELVRFIQIGEVGQIVGVGEREDN